VARESHCKPIGFGAMLLEGFVALIALATVLILTPAESRGMKPGQLYGDGMARFLAVVFPDGSYRTLRVFGAMAFSTFVFDTLDVATRLGRYILQELTGRRSDRSAITATALTAGVPLAILLAAGKDSYATFWTLFGTSNQLLAGLTLLGVSVWLRRTGRPCWFTILPMLFMMTITVWSLAGQILTFFRGKGLVSYANGVTARGRLVFIAGMIGWDAQGVFHSDDFAAQARQALDNVAAVLREAGARPEHIVRMTWYVTDKREYLAAAREIGHAYRELIGRHYPAMAVVQVVALVEDEAKVEIETTAVIPDKSAQGRSA